MASSTHNSSSAWPAPRGTVQSGKQKATLRVAETTIGMPGKLFVNPDICPLRINSQTGLLTCVRLSRQAYRDWISLGMNGARQHGEEIYQFRVDDVLLAAAKQQPFPGPTHYILHMAYCCSTLLTRYLDLLSSCFVLKEPQVLAELALAYKPDEPLWDEHFNLLVRLLSRTYEKREVAIIKAHVPCNVLGERLLKHNPASAITFLVTPLRSFVLSVLKSQVRRRRVRYWLKHIAPAVDRLASINVRDLMDGQAAVCFWVLNRCLCDQLCSGPNGSRVLVVDGDRVADSPHHVLPAVAARFGLFIDKDQLKSLLDHPSVHHHAKHPSRPYDALSRLEEMNALGKYCGSEADASIAWATSMKLLDGLSEG
jgi:hypothetical protein